MTTQGPAVVAAVPDRNRRLGDGVIVDACIVARLLGLRILKLDARVMVLPADVATPSPAPSSPPRRSTSARSSGNAAAPSGAVGGVLADAVRCINEGAATLSEIRRDGSANGADDT